MIAVGSLVMLTLAGCSSTSHATGGVKSLTVEVSQRGSILFEGHPVQRSRLAKALKRAGATSRTAIRVSLPKNTSPSVAKQLTETLVAAGLPRVIFSTPRKATAEKATRR